MLEAKQWHTTRILNSPCKIQNTGLCGYNGSHKYKGCHDAFRKIFRTGFETDRNCLCEQQPQTHSMCLCTFLGIPTMRSGTFLVSLACLLATPLAAPTSGNNGGKAWTSEQVFPLGGYKHFDCGADKSSASEHLLNFHKELYYNQTRIGSPATRHGVKIRTASSSAPIAIDVAFHIVSTTDQQHLVQQ